MPQDSKGIGNNFGRNTYKSYRLTAVLNFARPAGAPCFGGRCCGPCEPWGRLARSRSLQAGGACSSRWSASAMPRDFVVIAAGRVLGLPTGVFLHPSTPCRAGSVRGGMRAALCWSVSSSSESVGTTYLRHSDAWSAPQSSPRLICEEASRLFSFSSWPALCEPAASRFSSGSACERPPLLHCPTQISSDAELTSYRLLVGGASTPVSQVSSGTSEKYTVRSCPQNCKV